MLVMVEGGEDVVIARAGRPIARLVKYQRPSHPRELGALRGKIWISPDFDQPDREIDRMFSEGPVEPPA